MTSLEKGNLGLAKAIEWFAENGYRVSIPLNDTQKYDLIVEKDMKLQTVQCKTTWNKRKNTDDSYMLSLRTVGGTKGKRYYVFSETGVDLLFCYRGDGIKYLIPAEAIIKAGIKSELTLLSKNTADKHFRINTAEYIVK